MGIRERCRNSKTRLKGNMKEKDYGEISARHREIARRLVKPGAGAADWAAFVAEVKPYVVEHFALSLKSKGGIDAEDFVNVELLSYFAADKCAKFRQFLSLKGPTCHFASPWFVGQLQAAVNDAISKAKLDPNAVSTTVTGEDGEEADLGELQKSEDAFVWADSEPSGNPIMEAIEQGGPKVAEAFDKIFAVCWRNTPHECYAAMMDWQLGFDQRKIAALFGYDKVDKVAGNIRDLKRKIIKLAPTIKSKSIEEDDRDFFDGNQYRGWGMYRADGEEERDAVEVLGTVRTRLRFVGKRDDGRGRLQVEMRFPVCVSKEALIRCTLRGDALVDARLCGVDATESVPPGECGLFVCGAFRRVRRDGDFEITVDEFAAHCKSSEMYYLWSDGKRSDVKPVVSGEREQYALTGELVRKWASRHVLEGGAVAAAAEFLNDFGPALSVMLARTDVRERVPPMSELLSRFGIPATNRAKIRRSPNEAWLLFRADVEIAADSPLDPNGFLMPVEWVYDSLGAGVQSRHLSANLIALGDKVLKSFGVEGWKLEPSARFFDERVSFCDETLFGMDEKSVASATAALAVALEYATRRIAYPKWPFNSIAWDFTEDVPHPVGGLRQKALLARDYGADRLFVAPGQGEEIAVDGVSFVRTHGSASLPELAQEIAYSHLDRIRSEEPVTFRVPADDEYLEKRRKTVDLIRAKVNPKPEREPRSTFVTLFGRPGMGKSVLMGLLVRDMERRKWAILPFACRAGKTGQGLSFVKSLAYALARHFGEVHELYAKLECVPMHATGEALEEFYLRAVCEPVSAMARKYGKLRQIVIVVDGLDEDAGGEVLSLLSNPKFKMPTGVGVVVSSRRLPQDTDRLAALSTAVIDLNGDDAKLNDDCDMDLKAYIELWLLRNGNVNRALRDANVTSDVVKETICRKDKSFLYAYHVLNGVAEGRYSLDRLDSELPVDLRAAFFDSFVARFPSDTDYDRVKPLLRLLAQSGDASLAAGKECAAAAGMNIGRLVQSLRGYVAVEGERVVLIGEPLRDWLADELDNPRFGVGK